RGRGVARVASRRQRDRGGAEKSGAGDGRRLAARLERVRRVERLVLDVEPLEAECAAKGVRGDERRESLVERDGLFLVEERHQLAVPPHVRGTTRQAVP